MTVIPRLVKLRSSSLLTSASSSGTIPGQVLQQRDLDPPTSANILANSTPTAPRPDDHDVLRQGVHLEDVVAGDYVLPVWGRGPAET